MNEPLLSASGVCDPGRVRLAASIRDPDHRGAGETDGESAPLTTRVGPCELLLEPRPRLGSEDEQEQVVRPEHLPPSDVVRKSTGSRSIMNSMTAPTTSASVGPRPTMRHALLFGAPTAALRGRAAAGEEMGDAMVTTLWREVRRAKAGIVARRSRSLADCKSN
jgi:hypothetical protein